MAFFLAKTDPGTYSIDDFIRDKTTVWDGVTNPVAAKAISTMAKGDIVFLYHSQGDSAVVALASRNFRWEGFGGVEDVANHLVGAVLMGVGGVTAMGCTVGQGLSGISTLSITSFIAVAAILAGSVAAFKYQIWRLDRMA